MAVERRDQQDAQDEPATGPEQLVDASGDALQAEAPVVVCQHCGRGLVIGVERCPTCGKSQRRQCFCGEVFPASMARCPACGTDWAKSVRIRRRSRSEKIKPRVMARNALLGAFVAVLVAGLVNLIVSALAQRATPEGIVPAHLSERMYYAWYTLFTSVSKLLASFVGGLGYTLIIALAGAIIGVLTYLLPTGWSKVSRGSRHRSHRTRRRRSEH